MRRCLAFDRLCKYPVTTIKPFDRAGRRFYSRRIGAICMTGGARQHATPPGIDPPRPAPPPNLRTDDAMAGPERPEQSDDTPETAKTSPFPPGDPRNDKIYLGILVALMVTVFTAAGMAIVGDYLYGSQVMKEGGFYIAIVAGIAYFAFRTWGRARAAKAQKELTKRQLAQDPKDDD
jgi:hypothetical protein